MTDFRTTCGMSLEPDTTLQHAGPCTEPEVLLKRRIEIKRLAPRDGGG